MGEALGYHIGQPYGARKVKAKFLRQLEKLCIFKFNDKGDKFLMIDVSVPKYSSMELQKHLLEERLKILIVDDHPEMIDYIELIIGKSCEVIKAYDAMNGLMSARVNNPDLVIIDIAMPGLNGFELLHKIRSDTNIYAVPVIMLSGLADDDAKIEALISGADDYLVKPFKPRELIVRIHAHVRMAKLRREAYQKEVELIRQISEIQQDMQSMLKNTKDAYLVLDNDFKVMSFNDAALCLAGLHFPLIQGKSIFECAPDLFENEFGSAVQHVVVTHAPHRMEYRTKSECWYELRIYPATHGISILGTNISEKKQAELVLIAAHEQLERRVSERTKELRESNELLRISEHHQKLLYQRLDTMRDEERKALSREVHDQLGQILSAAKIDIRLLEEGLSNNQESASKEALIDELRSARETIEQGIQIVRNIAKELRTPHLDAEGLFEAIQSHAMEFQAKTKTTCNVKIQENLSLPDKYTAKVIYRIYQEAMTNILRHARASEVAICLQSQGDLFRLRIIDNGVGIIRKSAEKVEGLGLLGMRERATSLQGYCRVSRIKPSGTIVSIGVPHR